MLWDALYKNQWKCIGLLVRKTLRKKILVSEELNKID